MPTPVPRRDHAKSVVDRSVRNVLARASGKSRVALLELVTIVRARSDLLKPRRVADPARGPGPQQFAEGLEALNHHYRDWIRKPAVWRPTGSNPFPVFSSLAHHLLAEYPVPPVLLNAWLTGPTGYDQYRARRWFKLAGRGRCLRELRLPAKLTRRMAHEFAHAPAHFSIGAALRWAQVRGLGGGDHLALAFANCMLAELLLPERDEFWFNVVRLFMNHPALDASRVAPVVEFLHDQKYRPTTVIVGVDAEVDLSPPDPDLSVAGWTPSSLLRRLESWEARKRPAGPERRFLSWGRSSIGEFDMIDADGRSWTVREVLDSDALADEGRAMEHCAATYTDLCHRRKSTVWSLRVETPGGHRRMLTVEVDPETREVIQAKAKGNDDPEGAPLSVLNEWIAREGLKPVEV